MGTSTPWGKSDNAERLAHGITFYSTPSHGGVKLSKTQNQSVAIEFRNADGWYEEDCEVYKVMFTFPDLFPKHNFDDITRALVRWYPDQFAAFMRRFTDSLSGLEVKTDDNSKE